VSEKLRKESELRQRVTKISALVLLSIIAVIAIIGAAFYWRLSLGPVSLNFMTGTIQSQINKNLTGMAVVIEDAVIERAAGSGIPQFRLRNIVLQDAEGKTMARAPRAAIGVDELALFTGRIVPKSLQLIGPRIFVRRSLEGGIELGFDTPAAAEDEAVVLQDDSGATAGKSDQEDSAGMIESETRGGWLIDALSGAGSDNAQAISSIEDIRMTEASIRLYDEANDSEWYAPSADLVFRRMPFGFTVFTNAAIANGLEAGTWRTEISASYRRDSKSFSIGARFYDLLPANISDQIFALSQLARVRVPLSGHAEIEMTDGGTITTASAEFSAAAGEVGLPDYLAQPIAVQEGSLRTNYDPATGGFVISDSALIAGGWRSELSGGIFPVRSADGRLLALKIDLKAKGTGAAESNATAADSVDRIDFSGTAAIEEARLDIDDLTVMAAGTGVRLHGTITGGSQSAGIRLAGRVKDLSSELLKRLWPPVVAPKTRNWVNQNIKAGKITAGEFRIDLPVDAMAFALRDKRLPDGSINLRFELANVTTSYFKDLPPLRNANGEAELRSNEFSVKVGNATLTLPSGREVTLAQGTMEATRILAPETPAVFTFNAKASAQTLLEYLDLPALSLITNAGVDSSRLGGEASLAVTLKLPLIKNLPRERVVVTATAKIENASVEGALPGIDITGGSFDIALAEGKIEAQGPAKINGIPATISWKRGAGRGARQSAEITAELDEKQREKVGARLDGYIRGPVQVRATIPDLADEQGRVDIEADLSKAELRLGAIAWVRSPVPKTGAIFSYLSRGEAGRRVENLEIRGPGLLIKGDIKLATKGGLREAHLTDVRLSEDDHFAIDMKAVDGGIAVNISGDRFDARPLIRSMFGPKTGGGTGGGDSQLITVNADIGRLYAHRGEVITGVTGTISTRGNTVQRAEIRGTFLSGQPIALRIVPAGDDRELRIAGRDGGAALRAANLYSKVAGGQIDFYALLANDANSSVRRGQLILRSFEVRNEAALAELDQKGKPRQSGPRKEGISFKRLTLPFTTDANFVRIGDSLIRGDDLGATAEGLIRKSDGAIDITGTIIPAYGANAALGKIPLLGDILTGGGGEGIFGLTYALGGTMAEPRFQVNPVSAIAPGILRKFFEFDGSGPPPQSLQKNSDKNG
jgi:hypothetical protein